MSSLQEALAAALAAPAAPAAKPVPKIPKPVPKPVPKPAAKPIPKVQDRVKAVTVAPGVRRVPIFTFADRYPLRPAIEEVERHSKSAPPPEHEPNFAERYFSRSIK